MIFFVFFFGIFLKLQNDEKKIDRCKKKYENLETKHLILQVIFFFFNFSYYFSPPLFIRFFEHIKKNFRNIRLNSF